MQPPSEHVHWMFATGFLLLGLFLLAEAVVGEDVWRRRTWRVYLWPSFLFGMGVLMWPVMTFYTTSTIHMVAHGAWAQSMMLAGAAELGLASGKLQSRLWRLALPFAVIVSGSALLLHERNPWFFQRSSFLHHLLGWTLLGFAIFPLARVLRPRSAAVHVGFAVMVVAASVMLFSDRDVAPVFGHLSPLAGEPRR
jgi:hypothetical protein